MRYTALIRAADRGHTEIVQLLLEAGAKVNVQDKDGPVSGPARWLARALLAGEDTKTKRGDTALIVAAGRGHVDIVRILLDAGAKVNAKNRDGTTALMAAERWGNTEIIEMLKQAGAKE